MYWVPLARFCDICKIVVCSGEVITKPNILPNINKLTAGKNLASCGRHSRRKHENGEPILHLDC